MFTPAYRKIIRDKIIQKIKDDENITSAAVIGSYARNEVDDYSDIDLTFGISKEVSQRNILTRYKTFIQTEFDGVFLFDLQQDETVYGVFLLPGCLQVDLSFTPQASFGPRAHPFVLLFGNQQAYKTASPHEPIEDKFGLIVHHLLRTKVCIERNQFDKAQEWLVQSEKHLLELNSITRDSKLSSSYEFFGGHQIKEKLNQCIDLLSSTKNVNQKRKTHIIRFLQEIW